MRRRGPTARSGGRGRARDLGDLTSNRVVRDLEPPTLHDVRASDWHPPILPPQLDGRKLPTALASIRCGSSAWHWAASPLQVIRRIPFQDRTSLGRGGTRRGPCLSRLRPRSPFHRDTALPAPYRRLRHSRTPHDSDVPRPSARRKGRSMRAMRVCAAFEVGASAQA